MSMKMNSSSKSMPDSSTVSGGAVGSGNNAKNERKKSSIPKPYNNYNIYFTLERIRLIEERRLQSNGSNKAADDKSSRSSPAPATGYENLDLPPLPPRYEHLSAILPANWCLPGKNRHVKRKHKASHGLMSFKEIASIAADNWRTIDVTTKEYAETVAKIQKDRYDELKQIEKKKEKERIQKERKMQKMKMEAVGLDDHTSASAAAAAAASGFKRNDKTEEAIVINDSNEADDLTSSRKRKTLIENFASQIAEANRKSPKLNNGDFQVSPIASGAARFAAASQSVARYQHHETRHPFQNDMPHDHSGYKSYDRLDSYPPHPYGYDANKDVMMGHPYNRSNSRSPPSYDGIINMYKPGGNQDGSYHQDFAISSSGRYHDGHSFNHGIRDEQMYSSASLPGDVYARRNNMASSHYKAHSQQPLPPPPPPSDNLESPYIHQLFSNYSPPPITDGNNSNSTNKNDDEYNRNNMAMGSSNHSKCEEVDVSDGDIMDVYHAS